jgi:hypothetical protein
MFVFMMVKRIFVVLLVVDVGCRLFLYRGNRGKIKLRFAPKYSNKARIRRQTTVMGVTFQSYGY